MEEVSINFNEAGYEYWTSHTTNGDDEILIKELLDDLSSPNFLLIPNSINSDDNNQQMYFSNVNELLHSDDVPYSGPTMKHIEEALLETDKRQRNEDAVNANISRASSLLENNDDTFRVENKYTLKMKSSGNGMMAEDGYKWRKYGQKCIKNSPNPRSYYRCTNPRCSAKKQIERSSDDPETLIVKYEGLHLHFTYPFSLHKNSPLASSLDDHNPPTKKPKTIQAAQVHPSHEHLEEYSLFDEGYCLGMESHQGLLQDVVPLTIWNPTINGFSK